MSKVINQSDIKTTVSGKVGSFFSRRTKITIGVTEKFIFRETSKGSSSETKIFPQNRIDSYGIEYTQSKFWITLSVLFLIVIPVFFYTNKLPYSNEVEPYIGLGVIGIIFLIIWMESRKLFLKVNTISKEKLEIKIKDTNTEDVENFIKVLNQTMLRG